MSWNRDTVIDVLIPAHNEEAALPPLLADIERAPLRRILVVDNNSSDQTAQVARDGGCETTFCPTPGYGITCLTGIDYLRKDPPDILVFLDGDRSDYPEHMVDLCTPIINDQADFVVGSRARGKAEAGSLTIPQRFGNWLATTLMNFFWDTQWSDLGPFRAIRWSSLEALNMQDEDYGWTIEMQIKAAWAGLRAKEVPVNYRARIGVSKISGTVKGVWGAGTKILYTIFKYRFLVPKPQRKKATT